MAQPQRQADVHQDELCPPNKSYALMDANKKIDLDNSLIKIAIQLQDNGSRTTMADTLQNVCMMSYGMKRISDKRTKNQAKTDKTEHGMEKREKSKSKSTPTKVKGQSQSRNRRNVKWAHPYSSNGPGQPIEVLHEDLEA
ncbi:hypothetical protein Tco_0998574 [Tanacetum coccineum]